MTRSGYHMDVNTHLIMSGAKDSEQTNNQCRGSITCWGRVTHSSKLRIINMLVSTTAVSLALCTKKLIR